eukprot:TRINITY_DN4358_c0_g1_i1.p1 TRINITY_DN4358_c0_g1~~TRINITY_DN4358_c0_g1_i1.p1  ORF type:complete len:161 (-),score=47.47 TRINITY_DN4358_c0_g1_i1:62-544(-)
MDNSTSGKRKRKKSRKLAGSTNAHNTEYVKPESSRQRSSNGHHESSRSRRRGGGSSGKKKRAEVNFDVLDVTTLKRYKRFYKLRVNQNASKDDLVTTISDHFDTQDIVERDVIELFGFLTEESAANGGGSNGGGGGGGGDRNTSNAPNGSDSHLNLLMRK